MKSLVEFLLVFNLLFPRRSYFYIVSIILYSIIQLYNNILTFNTITSYLCLNHFSADSQETPTILFNKVPY